MPKVDGFNLLACIRGHPRLKHLPIVVLTGNEEPQSIRRALLAGATSYLLKPLNWTAFGAHIYSILMSQTQLPADNLAETRAGVELRLSADPLVAKDVEVTTCTPTADKTGSTAKAAVRSHPIGIERK